MREGAWINVHDGTFEWVDEHASWVKQKANADKLGLPEAVWKHISKMPCDFKGPGRAQILLTVMQAGYIRMRSHGHIYAFEFTRDTEEALWACWDFLEKFAGDYTMCRFNNLRTRESIEMTYMDFKQRMQTDTESVLRLASKIPDSQFSAKYLL